MNRIGLVFISCAVFAFGLSACGGGGSSTDTTTGTVQPPVVLPEAEPPVVEEPPVVVEATTVTISGAISFDKVRQTNTSNAALNYLNIDSLPAAGIVVEALNSTGTVLDNTVTDDNGNYTINVAADTNIQIRAKAQLLDSRWDFKVTDNTNGDALYVLDGNLTSSGAENSTRDLHADSGWGGTAYTNTRAAAPFAMLDVVLTGIQQIIAVDEQTIFPAAEIRWSINNRPSSGSLADGDISTSFFTITNGLPTIYILGAENVDTDEYDEDVVAHEWGHYLESQLSRSDSIGGSHSLTNHLDMRLAFGEGFGNALSGVVNGDNFYVDSFGPSQANGFALNLETQSNFSPTGWFSEDSIQGLLFDIADSNDDGQDTLSLGMGGLISVLTADSYRQADALTSAFTFAENFKAIHPDSAAGLDNLLSANGINSDSAFAEGEINSGISRTNVLPVYTTLTVGGSAVNLCSTNFDGEQNRLGNYRFANVDIPTSRQYTITATRTSGQISTDPDFSVYKQGQRVLTGLSGVNNTETASGTLTAGIHIIELADFFNLDDSNTTGGVSCFDLSII